MYRTASVTALTVLAFGIAGCGSEPATPAATTTPAAAPAPAAYELTESGRQLTALVRTDDTGQLGAAFREISTKVLFGRPEGGYFVHFDCAYGNDPSKAANRLATGKIAVGRLGAAQTGLPEGETSIDYQTGRTCRDTPPSTPFTPGRALDRDYAVELCRGRVEDKYVADQRPVTLSSVNASQTAGKWFVTGVAQGKAKPGMGDMARMSFQCIVSPDPLATDLTEFKPIY